MYRMHSHRSMPLHTEVMMFDRLVSGDDCEIELRHPLAFAATLYRRCVVNKESATAVAERFGFDANTCQGVVRLLRKVGGIPSPERLAVIAQLDWGYSNADIAEIFGRSDKWSADVRANADAIRKKEPIPLSLEWLCEGLQPSDPSPEELWDRAQEVRGMSDRRPPSTIRSYAWRPTGAFVQNSAG